MNVYKSYLNVCTAAVKSEEVFSRFRRIGIYQHVVEGSIKSIGDQHIPHIKKKFPHILQHIDKFITSDTVGNPITHDNKHLDKFIAPTTCRYIKILAELVDFFGSLDDLDIVEIGGGYGGQCKIIYDYAKPRSYTIIDLPAVGRLAAKYLKCFGIEDVVFKTPGGYSFDESYSLCISNYAFSEFDRGYQDLYAEKIIKKSDKGYMVCNFFGPHAIKERLGGFTKKEIIALQPTGIILPEEPESAEGNFLYIWNTKEKI